MRRPTPHVMALGIVFALRTKCNNRATAAELAEALRGIGISTVRRYMDRLVHTGVARKVNHGTYVLDGPTDHNLLERIMAAFPKPGGATA